MRKLKILMVASAATMLSSCDLSQIPGLEGKLSMEDSKAVGAACRHSGRALEDCFTLNPKTHQSGVFEGWREMNDYMLANEIEVVKPEIQASAFKPGHDSASAGEAKASAEPETAHPDTSNSHADAVPPAQGRQRWVPKSAGEQSAAAAPPEQTAVPENQQAPSVADKPAASGSTATPSGAPPRPWERKKDPKNHT